MTLEEIKDYVDENFTEADIYHTYESDSDTVQEKLNKRLEINLVCREKKAGKNPFKRWFYLGTGKDKLHNISWRITPFDKARRRAFYKWRRKTEEKGIIIKRDYLEFDNHIGLQRYYNYQYSHLKDKIIDKLEWHPNLSTWDMTDILNALLIKLTILGVYHAAGFSHILHAKDQMHEIWYARKLLIDAITAEDKYNYLKEEAFKEKFHVSWNFYEKHTIYSKKKYVEEGIVSSDDSRYDDSNYFNLDPRALNEIISDDVLSTKNGRELALSKITEMEDYWHNLDKKDENLYYVALYPQIKMRKAFEYIEAHMIGWGD